MGESGQGIKRQFYALSFFDFPVLRCLFCVLLVIDRYLAKG
ncbi:hypothetical protein SELSPUOL_00220 [Selenomonas sputigena ATCC 35185]|uniref:Uncharacterized protein n=1 Tax=Selenomonas sputigena (strain ATCC 35185 / DSM 20758 / CCUG 44933 / VPI D19B-28) TaxID=546271 RepID=C9LRZ9_SELS3|nr:hypothetical protein SELSPUOL_00220 [Selenomonas sputigena ATCC 35185]